MDDPLALAPARPAGRQPKKSRVLVITLVVFLVALIGVVGVAAWMYMQQESDTTSTSATPTPTPVTPLTPLPTQPPPASDSGRAAFTKPVYGEYKGAVEGGQGHGSFTLFAAGEELFAFGVDETKGRTADASVSPDGTRVVIEEIREKGSALFVANIDGSNRREIPTQNFINGVAVAWTSDSQALIYDILLAERAPEGQPVTPKYSLEVYDIASNTTKAYDRPGEFFYVIHHIRGDEMFVEVSLNQEGSKQMMGVIPIGDAHSLDAAFVPLLASVSANTSYDVSPDGQLIVYARGTGCQDESSACFEPPYALELFDRATNRPRPLTTSAQNAAGFFGALFTPDGRNVVFGESDGIDGSTRLSIIGVDGANLHVLAHGDIVTKPDQPPAFVPRSIRPDGDRVIVTYFAGDKPPQLFSVPLTAADVAVDKLDRIGNKDRVREFFGWIK
jgi:hypothetical protein